LRTKFGVRPLYFDGSSLLCSRFNRIYRTGDLGASFEPVARLDIKGAMNKVLGLSPLAQRVLRSAVYRMRVLADGNLVFVFRKGIYTLENGNDVAVKTFDVTRGSRPVSLASKPGGLVVFADYWANRAREEVNVYGSEDGGMSWQKVHVFPPGEVRHVHGITYDRWEDCFWIVSGDYDDENCLFRAAPDFSGVKPAKRGGQANRFYSVVALERVLIMATDTPLEANYISVFDKRSREMQQVQHTQNSTFYSCAVGRRIFISTNAEPSAANDTEHSHLWMGLPDYLEPWRHIAAYRSDLWDRVSYKVPGVPSGLFQFPRIYFPDGENNSGHLVCHMIGLRGLDNAMVVFDVSQWNSGP
jgi:hypothetical protein